MKIKILIFALFLGIFNLNAYEGNYDVFHKEKNNTTKEKVDCSDPKNRPRVIGGILRGEKKSAIVTSMLKQLNVT